MSNQYRPFKRYADFVSIGAARMDMDTERYRLYTACAAAGIKFTDLPKLDKLGDLEFARQYIQSGFGMPPIELIKHGMRDTLFTCMLAQRTSQQINSKDTV